MYCAMTANTLRCCELLETMHCAGEVSKALIAIRGTVDASVTRWYSMLLSTVAGWEHEYATVYVPTGTSCKALVALYIFSARYRTWLFHAL